MFKEGFYLNFICCCRNHKHSGPFSADLTNIGERQFEVFRGVSFGLLEDNYKKNIFKAYLKFHLVVDMQFFNS